MQRGRISSIAAAVSAQRSWTNGFSDERPPARVTRVAAVVEQRVSMACRAPSAAVEMPRTKIWPNGSR